VEAPTHLTDGVVVLRPLAEDDRAAVLEYMRDPVVREWLNMPATPGNAEFATLLRIVREGAASGDRFDLVVTLADDDTPLGGVVASRRHRDNYELAYLAGAPGRGRGYMTRAVRLVCDWLFAQGVGRLEVRTHPDNVASQRLAERSGFQQEGRERRSIWLHGRRADALLWSLLPDDPR
jgi:RimJ/RimL family protein N-acetyltransferase